MSDPDYLFLAANIPIDELADRLTRTLHLRFEQRDDTLYLGRDLTTIPAPAGAGPDSALGYVGGDFEPNIFAFTAEDPTDRSVMDGYPYSWTISYAFSPSVQHDEAHALFTDVADLQQWPVVLTHSTDLAVAAWHPTHGLRTFPAQTSADHDGEPEWGPWAVTL